MQVHFSEQDIRSLLRKAQIFNREIGAFVSYEVNEIRDYIVWLDNGSIYFNLRDFRLDAEKSFTAAQLDEISSRFRSNEKFPKDQLPEMNPNPILLEFWMVPAIAVATILISMLVLFSLWPTQETEKKPYEPIFGVVSCE